VRKATPAIVLVIAVTVAAAAQSSARDAVTAMLGRIDALSARGDLADVELSRRFRAIAGDHMDRSHMASAALGGAALRLSPAEWQRYAAAFDVHMGLGFAAGVREYGASESRVLGERITPAGKTVVIARIRSKAREQDTVFYMCDRKPSLVCDVEVNGVRASARQRTDFLRMLDDQGLDALIEALKAGRLVEVR
jgi:ABC-type transporter MlaC component